MEKFNHQSRSHHCRRSAMTHRCLGVIFLSALVSGCAPVSPTASEDRALFESLCNAPDRNFSKDPVFVKGYAQARAFEDENSCLDIRDAILFEGFEYHECVQGAWRDGQNKNITVSRYSLKPDEDVHCLGDEKKQLKKWLAGLQQRENKFSDQCISVEKYNEPKSRYIKIIESGHVSKDGKHLPYRPSQFREIAGYIAYTRTVVIDRGKTEKIFERRHYRYYPMGAKNSDLMGGKLTCNESPQLQQRNVLKPITLSN